jgi:predicted nucleotidyltransferase
MTALPDIPVLAEVERSCLARYVELIVDELGEELVEVVLFGSVARGETWPRGMAIRSDIDVLVVTASELPTKREQELVGATYELFLECGRQIGPHFRTRAQFEDSSAFLENVRRDGIRLYG